MTQSTTIRLNPFFIRSAVGMTPDEKAAFELSLNPFFIRSAVGIIDEFMEALAETS